MLLSRRGEAGFDIEPGGSPPVVALAGRKGLEIRIGGGPPVWNLSREGGPLGAFRLFATGDGRELGRTLSLAGVGQRRELRYFLLGDGRLFRLITSGPAPACYDLTGWETPGPYLRVRAHEAGWKIVPTPASGGIDDLLALAVLLSAEILDAEEPLVCGDGSGSEG